MELGYRHVAVLDVAPSSLDLARRRLGAHADRVTWVVGDVLDVELPELVDVWHDRAVFHFLTEPDDVENYARRAAAALRPGGMLVIGTFALDGPDRCSGLPVVRYDASSLSDALGGPFDPEDACDEVHVTPTGVTQPFQYATFRRRS